MKQRGKKRLFSTLTTKLAVEERSVAYNEICRCLIKFFLGHVETGKPMQTDENLWVATVGGKTTKHLLNNTKQS